RRVNPTLLFCRRHPLNTMDPRFKLEQAVSAIAADAADHLLITACCSLSYIEHGHFQSPFIAEPLVHPPKVARKKRSFVSTRTSADLQEHVLVVIGVPRDQQFLEFSLQLLNLWLKFVYLQLGQFPHFFIFFPGENILRLFQMACRLAVLIVFYNYLLQVTIFLTQL